MADATSTEKAAAKVADSTSTAPANDHDRVVALSVRADGSLDQNAPELIGDKEAALAATREQFAQQATAAVDAAAGPVVPTEEGGTDDKLIDARKAEHDKAVSAAEKQAESVVNQLHNG